MNNEQLYEQALKAIRDLYNDMSVSKEEAANNLNALVDEIHIMIDALGEE